MKIIKPGYQIIDEKNLTKKIEKIARICYKSEDKITEGTDVKMIENLLNRQHTAMLEHASICFETDKDTYYELLSEVDIAEHYINHNDDSHLKDNYLHFTKCDIGSGERYVVSGNVRAWYETCMTISWIPRLIANELARLIPCIFNKNFKCSVSDIYSKNPSHFVKYITDYAVLSTEERMVHETLTVLFTVDRGVTHELVRMRPVSFAQESTRYCNYSLGKFGDEITVILPCFFDTGMGTASNSLVYEEWKTACKEAEKHYFKLLEYGAKPQEARDVLPTSVKADIAMTTNLAEWKHIFNLRACDATGPAHPQMKEVMVPLLKEVKETYTFAFGDMIPAE